MAAVDLEEHEVEEPRERGKISEFDVKGDQNVNLEEMVRQLDNVHIQADVFFQRLTLEKDPGGPLV